MYKESYYTKIQNDSSLIAEALEYYNQQYQEATTEISMDGSIQEHVTRIPGIVEYRYGQLQEIEAILQHYEILLAKKFSYYFRQYFERYNKQLTSRDAEKFANGEEEIYSYKKIINHISLIRNKYLGIIKALESKQYQLNNVIKLRTSGLVDITI